MAEGGLPLRPGISRIVDEAKALGWIAAAFGSIARPQRKLDPEWTEEPVQDGERRLGKFVGR